MDAGVWEASEFRHPAADIGAVGVKFTTLQDRVEHPEIGRRIGAATGDPLPGTGVGGEVGVDQGISEPGLAQAPVVSPTRRGISSS